MISLGFPIGKDASLSPAGDLFGALGAGFMSGANEAPCGAAELRPVLGHRMGIYMDLPLYIIHAIP